MADGEFCGDCHAAPGDTHKEGCDVAVCRTTGIQWIQCSGDHKGSCAPNVWTGWWVGEREAIARGWFSYWGPPWVQCGPDDPNGSPDLNRARSQLRWDSNTQSLVGY